MKLKMALPLVLGLLTLAPAAVLASQNQVRLQAFTSEGRVLAQSRHLAASAAAPVVTETITVDTVEIVAKRPRTVAGIVARSACGDWRALQSGPKVRASGLPLVRACETAPERVTAASRQAPATTKVAADRAHYDFVVDLSAPR